MTKYKCNGCNSIFDGDLSTMHCPNCGSANIKKARSGLAINQKWLVIGGVVLGAIGLIIFLSSLGDDKVVAKMEVSAAYITIEVNGPSASSLFKDYQVIIFNDNNVQHGDPIRFSHKQKNARYSIMQLMEGCCYTFHIERRDGKPIPNLVWETSHQYCVPIPAVKPEIKRIDTGIADRETQVWNEVKIIMKKAGDFTYTIGDKSQSSPEFNNLKPGNYTVIVRNEEGVSTSQSFFLRKIKKLPPKLTLAQVQVIFDEVSSGSISASNAQEKLAQGNVNLATKIQPSNVATLWGALIEAEMGVRFKIQSFENDPNTNKIKSGTLRISIIQ